MKGMKEYASHCLVCGELIPELPVNMKRKVRTKEGKVIIENYRGIPQGCVPICQSKLDQEKQMITKDVMAKDDVKNADRIQQVEREKNQHVMEYFKSIRTEDRETDQSISQEALTSSGAVPNPNIRFVPHQ